MFSLTSVLVLVTVVSLDHLTTDDLSHVTVTQAIQVVICSVIFHNYKANIPQKSDIKKYLSKKFRTFLQLLFQPHQGPLRRQGSIDLLSLWVPLNQEHIRT